jgi:glycosyltransferase involved in cell wall biosynthesis
MSTICLNMIVKDEARVIRRCLDSVLPHLDAWVIMDTGSTDGTQDLVRKHLRDVPGELFEGPWTDFGRARTEALARVGGRSDYILVMDADDVLVCPEGYRFPALTADAYTLLVRLKDPGTRLEYFRPHLVAAGLPWRYEGAVHEHLACDRTYSEERLAGPHILSATEGARSRDPEKYLKDARLLEDLLARDPTNPRNAFYLAQSYACAGRVEESIAAYRRRIALPGWVEETAVAMNRLARLLASSGRPAAEVIEAHLRAFEFRPCRAEPLCDLARFFRERREFQLAHLFASKAAALPKPAETLFLEDDVYGWRALDELAVAAYWVDRREDCRDLCVRLLTGGQLPEAERARVQANLDLARASLA